MIFDQLSFVGQDTSGEYPKVRPWAPTRSGDYSEDCRRGRAYFGELYDLMIESNNPTFLSRVLSAQVAGGKWEAVEIGFSQAMAEKVSLASLV